MRDRSPIGRRQATALAIACAAWLGGLGAVSAAADDQQLAEEIRRELRTEAPLAGVRVEVREGTVILEGRVPAPVAKMRAEVLARSVRGVERLENRIEVDEAAVGAPPPAPEAP